MPPPTCLTPKRTPLSPLSGFTLVELLTVIAIIGILAAILIPTVGKIRENARQVQCISRIRECGTALQIYSAESKDTFLPVENTWDKRWHILLVPYLNAPLAEAFKTGQINSDQLINSGFFKCPTMDRLATGNAGAFAYNRELEVSASKGATRISELTTPSTFPVLVTSGENGGPRLFASNYGNLGPTKLAQQHGYSGGPTNDFGPNPNFGNKAVFLFGDWHVAAKNVCIRNEWPWNDSDAFKIR